jgi:hypothetical protein
METKKLKFQTVAAGNQGTVDATIVEGENKENNAAKTAGMAAAGIAAGAAAGYAGYEVYQQFAGTVEAEPMTADEALDAVAGLTADNTVTEPVVEAQLEPVVAAEPVAETQPAATTQHTTTTETTVNPDDVSDEILAADIIDPTAENIAKRITDQIPECYKTKVQESGGNTAIYEIDDFENENIDR